MTDAPDLVTDAELERRFTYRTPKGDQPARYSQIEPALTPEEWEKLFSEGNDGELERERFSIWRYDAGDPFPVEVRAHAGEMTRFDVRTGCRAAPAEEGRWRMTIELIAVALCSIVIHEWAHAAVADLEGDPTPRLLGRLTANPAAHLDPIGSVAVPAVLYLTLGIALGWCRPVPLTPARMRHGRRSLARVIAAGPAANLALAGVCAIVGYHEGASVNLALAFFNLAPIGSLDGGRLLRLALTKEEQ